MTDKQSHTRIDAIKGYIQLALVIIFILASFAISGLLNVTKKPIRQKEVAERTLVIEAMEVAPASHRVHFDATGMINPRAKITITPEVSGRIVAINNNVFAGGIFNAGELLFQIDPTDYQLDVKRLEALVAESVTAYELEEAESNLAKQEWKQIHGDQAIPDLVARRPQLDEAWAQLKSAQAQLESATLDLERTVFSLPFSGRIISSDLSVGQYVTAGQSYGTSYEMDELEVQASIDQTNLSWLMQSANPDITITTHYQGEKQTFKGVLKRSAAELESTTRLAQIAVGLDNNIYTSKERSRSLLPGVFTTLNILGPVLDNVLSVPSSALQKGGDIYLIDPLNNSLTPFTPDIVFDDGTNILIKGLAYPVLIATSKVPGGDLGIKVRYTMRDGSDAPSMRLSAPPASNDVTER